MNIFFKKKKNQNENEPKKKSKTKRGWRVFWIVISVLGIVGISYIGFLYASGNKVFDPKSLTQSPFFKSSKNTSTLRGEGDGRINILLLGMGGANHPGGTLTDTIMVISIDPNDKSLAMLSIPRDLYVPIAGRKQSSKINEVYSIGEKEKAGNGPVLLKETVGNILDLPIHYYVVVDFYGFVKFVNEIGGVDVLVDKNLYDPYFPDANMQGYDPFYIKAGQQHLDGAVALKYARSRETTSDFDRAARQQKIITAVKEKCLSANFLANPKKILDVVQIVGDHVRTDFTASEIIALADLAKQIDSSKTVSKVLTSATDGELVSDSSSGTYYLLPKDKSWEQIQGIAHEIFTDPNLRQENAKIEVLNASSTAGLGSKLAQSLKSYNYNVVSIKTADKKQTKTEIIDYTNGQKSATLNFLKNRLNTSIAKKTQTDSSIDITIIIGDDYKGFSKSP